MVDVILANKLVKAVAPGAHLLLVGDVDQLPSVGAGEVLRDLLGRRTLPVVRLTKIFRQAQQSGIVVNAHRINAGQPPALTGFPDFFWFTCEDDRGNRRPGGGHRRPADPGQVRPRPAPRRAGAVPDAPRPGRGREPEPAAAGGADPVPRGRAGAALRRPGVPGRRQGHPAAQQLRQGHRRASSTAPSASSPACRWRTTRSPCAPTRTRQIDYDFDELDELAHAYAVTIHRSQGSEYPAVVIPLTTSVVDDAAAQPALHRHHPGEETRRPGRLPPRPRRRRPHRGRRPPPHRPRPPPATRRSTHAVNSSQAFGRGTVTRAYRSRPAEGL